MDKTAVDAIYELAGRENPINTEHIYAIVWLDILAGETFFTWGDYMRAIDEAVKAQRPYTTYRKGRRNGHSKMIWQQAETRYFDPKK